jgi:hypothetical protein
MHSRGWIRTMVTFGGITLPNVLSVQITNAHKEIERAVPGRTIAHRMDAAELGRTIQISGEIRETSIDQVASDIEHIRSLNDGLARQLDLQDGSGVFYAQLTDPRYEISTDGWYLDHFYSLTGKFVVPYAITLLQTSYCLGHWDVDLVWDNFAWG